MILWNLLQVHTLVAANGQEMELSGQGEVEMVVRHVVLVTKSLTHDCLLGADFLTAHGCSTTWCLWQGNLCHLYISLMQMRTGCVMWLWQTQYSKLGVAH